MPYINRTIIIQASLVQVARTLASSLSYGGIGMFETPLYTGANLTHYVSSGWIDSAFDSLLPLEGSDQITKNNARDILFFEAQGLATIEQCQSLVDTSIIVDCDIEPAESTFIRLGITNGI